MPKGLGRQKNIKDSVQRRTANSGLKEDKKRGEEIDVGGTLSNLTSLQVMDNNGRDRSNNELKGRKYHIPDKSRKVRPTISDRKSSTPSKRVQKPKKQDKKETKEKKNPKKTPLLRSRSVSRLQSETNKSAYSKRERSRSNMPREDKDTEIKIEDAECSNKNYKKSSEKNKKNKNAAKLENSPNKTKSPKLSASNRTKSARKLIVKPIENITEITNRKAIRSTKGTSAQKESKRDLVKKVKLKNKSPKNPKTKETSKDDSIAIEEIDDLPEVPKRKPSEDPQPETKPANQKHQNLKTSDSKKNKKKSLEKNRNKSEISNTEDPSNIVKKTGQRAILKAMQKANRDNRAQRRDDIGEVSPNKNMKLIAKKAKMPKANLKPKNYKPARSNSEERRANKNVLLELQNERLDLEKQLKKDNEQLADLSNTQNSQSKNQQLISDNQDLTITNKSSQKDHNISLDNELFPQSTIASAKKSETKKSLPRKNSGHRNTVDLNMRKKYLKEEKEEFRTIKRKEKKSRAERSEKRHKEEEDDSESESNEPAPKTNEPAKKAVAEKPTNEKPAKKIQEKPVTKKSGVKNSEIKKPKKPVKEKKERSRSRTIERKADRLIRATAQKRGRPTKNFVLKQNETDELIKNLESKNQRPVIIQQKLNIPMDSIQELILLMKEKTAQEKITTNVVARERERDNISVAILRALHSIGTKGLYKKILNWASENYREEVVQSIRNEFGLRVKKSTKRGEIKRDQSMFEGEEELRVHPVLEGRVKGYDDDEEEDEESENEEELDVEVAMENLQDLNMITDNLRASDSKDRSNRLYFDESLNDVEQIPMEEMMVQRTEGHHTEHTDNFDSGFKNTLNLGRGHTHESEIKVSGSNYALNEVYEELIKEKKASVGRVCKNDHRENRQVSDNEDVHIEAEDLFNKFEIQHRHNQEYVNHEEDHTDES